MDRKFSGSEFKFFCQTIFYFYSFSVFGEYTPINSERMILRKRKRLVISAGIFQRPVATARKIQMVHVGTKRTHRKQFTEIYLHSLEAMMGIETSQ